VVWRQSRRIAGVIKQVRWLAPGLIRDTVPTMKRMIAWFFALLSGLYLLVSVPIPDPLPFVDEATALLIFLNATAYLGFDLRRWLPFFGKAKPKPAPIPKRRPDVTVDV